MSFDLNFEDDIIDEEVMASHSADSLDFVSKIAESCPGPLRTWLLQGSQKARFFKFFLLIVGVAILLFAILLVILSVTFFVLPSGDDEDQTPLETSLISSQEASSAVGSSDAQSSDAAADDEDNTPTVDDSDLTWTDLRLPTWAAPLSYAITLEPQFEDFTFQGFSTVVFTIEEEGHDFLVMHCADLNVVSVTDANFVSLNYHFEENLQYIIIDFNEALSVGEHEVLFEFAGDLRDDMAGFYKSSYTDEEDGDQHWLASTQFEATDARRAFPCFDEPQLKATFQITLIIDDREGLVALSNMGEIEDGRYAQGDKVVVPFKETPRMSTYLVAFIIGEFASVRSVDLNGREVAVWAPVGMENYGRVALEASVDVVAWFEEFFGIPYALDKIDLVAIPDFAAGAMENWGLITFRLTAVLFDEENDSAANRQRVATVVAHELAHQWTGDYVTCAYWGNLWLNEGFANFFETESVNAVRPDWQLRDQFLFEDQQRAMGTDALATTHPLVMDPHTENEISAMFDSITYSKGGSVLRMLQAYIHTKIESSDMFQTALHNYLDTYQYSNTITDQLLDSLTETTELPIADTFHDWVYESGFPVLHVTLSAGDVTVAQRRFRSNGEEGSATSWFVPIEYAYETNDGMDEDFFELSESEAVFSVPASASWVKLNANQNGFYRVNYELDQWTALAAELQAGTFTSAPDRIGLINDALVLGRSGFLPTSNAMDICCVLHSETEYAVWASALSELNYIGQRLVADAVTYRDYTAYMQTLLTMAYETVGWGVGEVADGDLDHNAALLRASILGNAVHHGLPEAIEAALNYWELLKTDDNFVLPADDRAAVYEAAMAYGTAEDYWTLLDMYLSTSNAAEEKRILYALGATKDYSLLQYTLQATLDESIVRLQDQGTVIAGVAANPLGRDLAWDFYRENFDVFNFRGFAVSNIVTYVTRQFGDELHLREVQEFFAANPTNGADIAVQQGIETIEANIQWLSVNSDPLSSYTWTC